MWLTRKQNNSPPQQLGLQNVVPATKEVEIQAYQYHDMYHNPQMYYLAQRRMTDVITTFEGLASTIDTLNEDLKKSPLQGCRIAPPVFTSYAYFVVSVHGVLTWYHHSLTVIHERMLMI